MEQPPKNKQELEKYFYTKPYGENGDIIEQ